MTIIGRYMKVLKEFGFDGKIETSKYYLNDFKHIEVIGRVNKLKAHLSWSEINPHVTCYIMITDGKYRGCQGNGYGDGTSMNAVRKAMTMSLKNMMKDMEVRYGHSADIVR